MLLRRHLQRVSLRAAYDNHLQGLAEPFLRQQPVRIVETGYGLTIERREKIARLDTRCTR